MSYIADQVLKYVRLPFDGGLHEYQGEDLSRYPKLDRCGYFYDLGLGKSVMAAIAGGWKLLTDAAETVVVLAPASLGFQWYEMLTFMGFKTLFYAGSPSKRKTLNLDVDFIICSFEIFQRDYDTLSKIPKPYFVVDEATILRNHTNILWKMLAGGVREIKVREPNKIKIKKEVIQYPTLFDQGCLLTATPMNKPADAFGLIKILDPEIYGSKAMFDSLHIKDIDIFDNPTEYDNLELLRQNLLNSSVIRYASDHIDLPDKVYNIIEYDLRPAHYKLYKELVETRMVEIDGQIKVEALQATALYHAAQRIIMCPEIAGYEKDSAGLEILDTIIDGVRQILLVNQYTDTNTKLMGRYEKYGIGGSYGDISRARQQKYVEAFKRGELRVLTCHPKSGGYGLNLQICDQICIPECPVTVEHWRQVEGRIYRQGQKADRVIITVLVARNTIQVKLLKNLMKRDEIVQEVIPTPTTLRQDLYGIC